MDMDLRIHVDVNMDMDMGMGLALPAKIIPASVPMLQHQAPRRPEYALRWSNKPLVSFTTPH